MTIGKLSKRIKVNARIYKHALLAKISAYHAPGDYSDADPFKIIYVDPKEIKYVQLPVKNTRIGGEIYTDIQGRFDKYRNVGRVFDGDWDKKKAVIEEHCDIYRFLYDRFNRNMEWSDSEVYKKFANEIHKGKVIWHGCATIHDLKARCVNIDALYNKIAENGYKLNDQSEDIDQTDLKFYLRKIDLISRLNEVTVNIDRHGSMIHNSSGTHRKIIAKLLGIKKIPVRVLLRHKKWQAIRNAILMTKQPEECNLNVRSLTSNPDLDDIIPHDR